MRLRKGKLWPAPAVTRPPRERFAEDANAAYNRRVAQAGSSIPWHILLWRRRPEDPIVLYQIAMAERTL